MKIKLMFLVMLCICGFAKAQKDLQIEFSVINCESSVSKYITKTASLRANKSHVLFTELECYNQHTEFETVVNQAYKDLQTNTMYSLEDGKRVVKETMNLFNWKFSSQIDTILNYACRKATAKFRGRTYEAWFTTDIPFRAAPWKVHGLPGVVLRLEVDRNYYVLEAFNLSVGDSMGVIKTPFQEKKSVNWTTYVEIYKKEQNQFAKANRAMEIERGKKFDFAYPKIEIIIEKNRESFDQGAKRMGLMD